MTSTVNECGEIFPPGTVTLTGYQDSFSRARVVLSPQPSKDPNEPLNWPTWRKVINMALIFGMTLAVFTNLMVQTVFWQQMKVDMKVSTVNLNNAQSANLAGLALGCLFFIPLTVKYGRRPSYLLSIVVLAGATWWTSKMKTNAELIVTAVISGLAGAINETAVQMTIADLFFVHQRGAANAVYFGAVMMGSFLTPLAAGSQAATQGWRWSYYTLSICLTILFVLFLFAYEETKYIPVYVGTPIANATTRSTDDGYLKKTCGGSSDETQSPDTIAKLDSAPSLYVAAYTPNTYRQRMRLWTPTGESLGKLFLLPFQVIMLPHVLFTSLQFAAVVAWLVLVVAMISVIFSMPPYSFTTAGVGYMTLGPFVGNVFGTIYGGPLSDWVVVRLARRNKDIFEPEMRLHLLCVPVVTMAGGLIMFGVTADRGMHWIFPSIGGACYAFGMGSIGEIAFTVLVDSYRDLVAESFIVVAFFRNALSMAVPFAMVPWWVSMGLSNMFITVGCLSLFIGLLYIPLLVWGKHIRIQLAPRYEILIAKKRLIG
ncbi:hypothetical protein PMIN02_008377 [Paraphaeosphaeria minitans]